MQKEGKLCLCHIGMPAICNPLQTLAKIVITVVNT